MFLGLICFVSLFFAIVFAMAGHEKEPADVRSCRRFLGFCAFMVALLSFAALMREPAKPAEVSKTFFIWNRTTRYNKGGYQITSYRHPHINLPAAEYMMGVEMAKNNVCNYFNFANEDDLARFDRCAHFFPEIRSEFNQRFSERVGICV